MTILDAVVTPCGVEIEARLSASEIADLVLLAQRAPQQLRMSEEMRSKMRAYVSSHAAEVVRATLEATP